MKKVKILVMVLISLTLIMGCTKGKINIDKINDNIVEGYEIAKISIDQIKIITNGLCETGVIQTKECIEIEGIYIAIDIIIPILDQLTLAIFHDQDEKNHSQNIAKYIIKLSEFNQSYYTLIKIMNKYK